MSVSRTKNYVTAYPNFHDLGLTIKNRQTKLLFKNERIRCLSFVQDCLRAISADFVLIHGFLPLHGARQQDTIGKTVKILFLTFFVCFDNFKFRFYQPHVY